MGLPGAPPTLGLMRLGILLKVALLLRPMVLPVVAVAKAYWLRRLPIPGPSLLIRLLGRSWLAGSRPSAFRC